MILAPKSDSPPPYDEPSRPADHPIQDVKSPPSTPAPGSSSSHTYPRPVKEKSWFSFGTGSASKKEIRSTILGLVRDIVHSSSDSHPSTYNGILESCADVCAAHDMSFSTLLQEKSLEGHTPIYWAIIKRSKLQPPNLILSFLTLSAPLRPSTVSDICHACILGSDQDIFSTLRCTSHFMPFQGADAMLLGQTEARGKLDPVTVEDAPGEGTGFIAYFEIVSFQKRMKVTKEIQLEFISQGRMWIMRFFSRLDKWVVSLGLMEHSPPAYIDSQLVIVDPSETRPAISVHFKTANYQLQPNEYAVELVLDSDPAAASLHTTGSPYLTQADSLKGRIEVNLTKPDTTSECIIC